MLTHMRMRLPTVWSSRATTNSAALTIFSSGVMVILAMPSGSRSASMRSGAFIFGQRSGAVRAAGRVAAQLAAQRLAARRRPRAGAGAGADAGRAVSAAAEAVGGRADSWTDGRVRVAVSLSNLCQDGVHTTRCPAFCVAAPSRCDAVVAFARRAASSRAREHHFCACDLTLATSRSSLATS